MISPFNPRARRAICRPVQWKPVAGWPYDVSSDGEVRNRRGNVLKSHPNSGGYLTVHLCRDGTRKPARVHRLVAQTFLENSSGLPYVNHKNLDKKDNHLENLEWCTVIENVRHAVVHGRVGAVALRRFPPHKIQSIQARYIDGETVTQIARSEAIAHSAIIKLLSGSSYGGAGAVAAYQNRKKRGRAT